MNKRVVIVTGCSGHLGTQICYSLKESSDAIVIFGIDTTKPRPGDHIDHFFPLDLGLLDDIPATVGQIEAELSCDRTLSSDYSLGVVNNAAFYGEIDGWGVDFLEETPKAWEQVFRVNLFAPFFLCQAMASLLRSHSGRVVNVSSIAGLVAPQFDLYTGTDMTNEASYGASKAGLNHLTKWLASWFAGDVRVNGVAPGGIERGQEMSFKDRYISRTISGRMATEIDISDVICFLLSDRSKYINGQVIAVDGGWTSI